MDVRGTDTSLCVSAKQHFKCIKFFPCLKMYLPKKGNATRSAGSSR